LDRDPRQRWQDAGEFVRAFKHALSEHLHSEAMARRPDPSTAAPPTSLKRAPRAFRPIFYVAVGALAAGALLTSGAAWILADRLGPSQRGIIVQVPSSAESRPASNDLFRADSSAGDLPQSPSAGPKEATEDAEKIARLNPERKSSCIDVPRSRLKLARPRRPLWRVGQSGSPFSGEVSPFCLDSGRVSVSEYRQCVDAGRCEKPRSGCTGKYSDPLAADAPMDCVSWSQAEQYCINAGGRLPTILEFEAWATIAGNGPGDDKSAMRPTACSPGYECEWAEDAFPPKDLGFRCQRQGTASCAGHLWRKRVRVPLVSGDRKLAFSWNQSLDDKPIAHLTFRCWHPIASALHR
jgi:hypothetical protein